MLKSIIAFATLTSFAGTMAMAGDCNGGEHAAGMSAKADVQATEPATELLVDNVTLVASLACAEQTGEALLNCLEAKKAATN